LKVACIALTLAFVPALGAQQAAHPAQTPASASPSSAAVPAPPQTSGLPKVFISNLPGADKLSASGGPGEAYNTFYAAVKKSGQFELVSDPVQADLIFELRYTMPWQCVNQIGNAAHESLETEDYAPHITLTIWDPKAHAMRGTYATDIKRAWLKKTVIKNYQQAFETLVQRAETAPGAAKATVDLGTPGDGPIPSPLGTATTIFIANLVDDRNLPMNASEEVYTQVYAAMKKWGRYKLVSSVADAELFADLAVTETPGPKCKDSDPPGKRIELRMMVPNTNIVVWGFTQDLVGWHGNLFSTKFSSSKKDVAQTADALVYQIRRFTSKADAAGASAKAAPPRP